MLEDMLRACILDHKGSWEEHLPLVEFAYDNSYQASVQMAPYEALYGRPCRSPLMSAKLIYVLSSFHMLFCEFYIHLHVKLITFHLNLVL